METQIHHFMQLAIDEAKLSLREGNCGFGAVIVSEGKPVCCAHDTERTQGDPTAHAEMSAIRAACATLGRDLRGCTILSTHEPCPMCTTAILWSGISTIAYGFSIDEAIQQERRRIDLSCREIFDRAGKPVTISAGVMHDECAVLYDKRVRGCIAELREADETMLIDLGTCLSRKRVTWYQEHPSEFADETIDILDRAYALFLRKLSISAEGAPIVARDARRIVIHSKNVCPTLAACEILNLDTRTVCRSATEKPMDVLLKQLNANLAFSRNYAAIRPTTDYCEEIISLLDATQDNKAAHETGVVR